MRLLIVTVAVLGFVLFSSNLLAQAAEGETRGIAPAPDIPRFERFLTERDVLNYIQATTEIEQTHKETLDSLQARFEASAEVRSTAIRTMIWLRLTKKNFWTVFTMPLVLAE